MTELCDLKWGDLDPQDDHWFISTRVTGDHHVRLPLSPDVATESERWLDVCLRSEPTKPILLAANGKKLKRGQLSPASPISYEHTSPEELIAARADQRLGEVDYLKNAKGYGDSPRALP